MSLLSLTATQLIIPRLLFEAIPQGLHVRNALPGYQRRERDRIGQIAVIALNTRFYGEIILVFLIANNTDSCCFKRSLHADYVGHRERSSKRLNWDFLGSVGESFQLFFVLHAAPSLRLAPFTWCSVPLPELQEHAVAVIEELLQLIELLDPRSNSILPLVPQLFVGSPSSEIDCCDAANSLSPCGPITHAPAEVAEDHAISWLHVESPSSDCLMVGYALPVRKEVAA